MSYTLHDLTYRTAREMGIVFESAATGGSTTTIVDTVMLTQADDYWNQGVAWILYDAGGAAAAPQGEYKVISDFANTGDTITLASAVSAAVAAGDRYAVCRNQGSFGWLGILIQKVNQALQDIGPVPAVDTSLTTAANQTEYTIPIAVKGQLLRVEIQTNVDTDDNQYHTVSFTVKPTSTAGSTDTLVLDNQPASGYTLKLTYLAVHPELAIYSDKMSEYIPIERVIFAAARDSWRHLRDWTGLGTWDDKIQELSDKAERAKLDYPIRRPYRQQRVHGLGDFVRKYPGDRTPR